MSRWDGTQQNTKKDWKPKQNSNQKVKEIKRAYNTAIYCEVRRSTYDIMTIGWKHSQAISGLLNIVFFSVAFNKHGLKNMVNVHEHLKTIQLLINEVTDGGWNTQCSTTATALDVILDTIPKMDQWLVLRRTPLTVSSYLYYFHLFPCTRS